MSGVDPEVREHAGIGPARARTMVSEMTRHPDIRPPGTQTNHTSQVRERPNPGLCGWCPQPHPKRHAGWANGPAGTARCSSPAPTAPHRSESHASSRLAREVLRQSRHLPLPSSRSCTTCRQTQTQSSQPLPSASRDPAALQPAPRTTILSETPRHENRFAQRVDERGGGHSLDNHPCEQ